MRLIETEISKSLNKAYLKQDLNRQQIDLLKSNLKILFTKTEIAESKKEHEEHFKNIVSEFLKETYYKQEYEININKRKDLVIHNGKSSSDSIGVIIEAKRPSNESEMVSSKNTNSKALHELLHYYMQERFINNNKEIKHIIATSCYDWYIFDASDFEKFFYENKKLRKSYEDWNSGILVGSNTSWFYDEIAKPFIDKEMEELKVVHFNLLDYKKNIESETPDDENLINLYKILSPEHLLKKPFANDSNTLNKEFYNELLHIIGLEERPDKGKKLIFRKKVENRDDGSFLENTINILRVRHKLKGIPDIEHYGDNEDEQFYSVALELCITWLDRILFLKLLEGQLIKYHHNNKDYSFINSDTIKDFDEVDELFFEVLAIKHKVRSKSVNEKYGNIPYLNSSLFEISDLENYTIQISDLKDRLNLKLYNHSVLKKKEENKQIEQKNTLQYLFEFLSAYNFSSDSSAKIQEDNKTIINASVLGLIFEKINGYKDGSFFTPGFITMYMCKETIRRVVAQKFNELENNEIDTFDDVKNYCSRFFKKEDVLRFNSHIDTIKICDPAVGSGHFLVSALNEILSIKSELNILIDSDGTPLEYEVTVENDELTVINKKTNEPFEYILGEDNKPPKSIQQVQVTLFQEKQKIIENCLFGVDINPKSVLICRLRLWIELLKNAYYKPDNYTELETLPNIDINIKDGDSLVNRFDYSEINILPKDRPKIKELVEHYKVQVYAYKNLVDNTGKDGIRKQIKNIKNELEKFALAEDEDFKKIRELEGKQTTQFLHFTQEDKENWLKEQELVKDEIQKLKKQYEQKLKTIYSKAFEWRFEFPEILDNDGKFVGFDLVIGNPPYIGEKDNSLLFDTIKKLNQWKSFYKRRTNLYYFFIKLSSDLLRPCGISSMIVPREFLTADWADKLREAIIKNFTIDLIMDFNKSRVFEDANTSSLIYVFTKPIANNYEIELLNCIDNKTLYKETSINDIYFEKSKYDANQLDPSGKKVWELGNKNLQYDNASIIPLGLLFEVSQGIVTGADKVTQSHIDKGYITQSFLGRGIFILKKDEDLKIENTKFFVKIDDKWIELTKDETTYIKPFISSNHLTNWHVLQSDEYVIYFGNNNAPNKSIISYLNQFKTILINRSKIDKDYFIRTDEFDNYTLKDIKDKYSSAGAVQKVMKKKKWYLPLYERAHLDFDSTTIIVNAKNMNIFCYSNKPSYSSGGGLGGQNFILPDSKKDLNYYQEIKKNSSISDYLKYINTILNSSVTQERIKKGKYNQLSTNKIKELLIYKIDFSDKKDLEYYNKIISLADNLILNDSDDKIRVEIDKILNDLFQD